MDSAVSPNFYKEYLFMVIMHSCRLSCYDAIQGKHAHTYSAVFSSFEAEMSGISGGLRIIHLSVWLGMDADDWSQDREEPGLLEQVKAQICENITMYAQKYDEEFSSHLPGFVTTVWNLLINTGSHVKYDQVNCVAGL